MRVKSSVYSLLIPCGGRKYLNRAASVSDIYSMYCSCNECIEGEVIAISAIEAEVLMRAKVVKINKVK